MVFSRLLPPLLLALMLVPSPLALAQETDSPEVPPPRERPDVPETSTAVEAPESVVPMPRPRPEPTAAPETLETPDAENPATPTAGETPAVPPSADDHTASEGDTPAEPESPPKPPRDYQVACPAVLTGQAVASALPSIEENMCGLQSPLSLEAVVANGRTVPLNTPVTTDCGMATALPGWVGDVDSWLMAVENTRIAKVNVGTGYMCRNVNNASEGNLSFHAFGDALDIIGFTLEDGRTIDVTTAWPGTVEQGSRIIRFAHDAACTHFTTVLGPEANAQHHDHLHIDLGCHGKTCTARLCE